MFTPRYSWNTANVDVKHQSIINHFSTIEMMWNQRALSFSVLFITSYVIFNIYLLVFCRFYILSVLCHTQKSRMSSALALPFCWVSVWWLTSCNFCKFFIYWFNFEIIWLSHILALSVHDEGYSRTASCALNWISTFLLTCFSISSHEVSIRLLAHIFNKFLTYFLLYLLSGGRLDPDRVVVRFKTICAISAYHH